MKRKYFVILVAFISLAVFLSSTAWAVGKRTEGCLLDFDNATINFGFDGTTYVMVISNVEFMGQSFTVQWNMDLNNGNWILVGVGGTAEGSGGLLDFSSTQATFARGCTFTLTGVLFLGQQFTICWQLDLINGKWVLQGVGDECTDVTQDLRQAMLQYFSFYNNEDLEGVMSLISPDYLNYGLLPEDSRSAKEDQFARYDNIQFSVAEWGPVYALGDYGGDPDVYLLTINRRDYSAYDIEEDRPVSDSRPTAYKWRLEPDGWKIYGDQQEIRSRVYTRVVHDRHLLYFETDGQSNLRGPFSRVTVNGPHIGTIDLEYNADDDYWGKWFLLEQGDTIQPGEWYTFTFDETHTERYCVFNVMDDIPQPTSPTPSQTVSGNPTFTWASPGPETACFNIFLSTSDSSSGEFFQRFCVYDTTYTYTERTLSPGTYFWGLMTRDALYNTARTDRMPFIVEDTIPEPEIIPGIRIGGIRINQTYGEVRSMMGSPDYTEGFIVFYLYEGISISFLDSNGNDRLDEQDTAFMVFASAPFSGSTAGGVAIGSPVSDVIDEFGSPEEVETERYTYYWYWSRGISFNIQQQAVFMIAVFEPQRRYYREKQEIMKRLNREIILRLDRSH